MQAKTIFKYFFQIFQDTDLELVSTGSNLTLDPVSKDDAGRYFCVASNNFGFVNQTFDVDVQCKTFNS